MVELSLSLLDVIQRLLFRKPCLENEGELVMTECLTNQVVDLFESLQSFLKLFDKLGVAML